MQHQRCSSTHLQAICAGSSQHGDRQILGGVDGHDIHIFDQLHPQLWPIKLHPAPATATLVRSAYQKHLSDLGCVSETEQWALFPAGCTLPVKLLGGDCNSEVTLLGKGTYLSNRHMQASLICMGEIVKHDHADQVHVTSMLQLRPSQHCIEPEVHLYREWPVVRMSPSCSWRVTGWRAVTRWPTCRRPAALPDSSFQAEHCRENGHAEACSGCQLYMPHGRWGKELLADA